LFSRKLAACVVRSYSGVIYDFLGWIYPQTGVPQDGMKFTTPDMDYDTFATNNCAELLGGGFWFNRCACIAPTSTIPIWYNRDDPSSQGMNMVHMMVKLQ